MLVHRLSLSLSLCLHNLCSNIFGSQNYLSSHVRNSRSRARKRLCQVILSDVKPNLEYTDNGVFTYSIIRFDGNVFSRVLVGTRGKAVYSHGENGYYYCLLRTRQKIIIIFIYCNWVVTRWKWLFYMNTKREIGY